MSNQSATVATDGRIVELVSSGITHADDGNVEIHIAPDDEEGPRGIGLRMTEDDALALADALRHAAEFVAGSDPQAFIRVVIAEPWPEASVGTTSPWTA